MGPAEFHDFLIKSAAKRGVDLPKLVDDCTTLMQEDMNETNEFDANGFVKLMVENGLPEVVRRATAVMAADVHEMLRVPRCQNTTRDGVLLAAGAPVFFLKDKPWGDRIPEVMEGTNHGGFMVWVGAAEGPVNWGYSTQEIAEQGALAGDRQTVYAKVRDITDGQILRMVQMVQSTFTDSLSMVAEVRRMLSTREEGDP